MSEEDTGPTDEMSVSRLRIAYESKGKEHPLRLLQGALGDRRVWRPQLNKPSDEFSVTTWDPPGCGQS